MGCFYLQCYERFRWVAYGITMLFGRAELLSGCNALSFGRRTSVVPRAPPGCSVDTSLDRTAQVRLFGLYQRLYYASVSLFKHLFFWKHFK